MILECEKNESQDNEWEDVWWDDDSMLFAPSETSIFGSRETFEEEKTSYILSPILEESSHNSENFDQIFDSSWNSSDLPQPLTPSLVPNNEPWDPLLAPRIWPQCRIRCRISNPLISGVESYSPQDTQNILKTSSIPWTHSYYGIARTTKTYLW
jgi:hypothetical protein